MSTRNPYQLHSYQYLHLNKLNALSPIYRLEVHTQTHALYMTRILYYLLQLEQLVCNHHERRSSAQYSPWTSGAKECEQQHQFACRVLVSEVKHISRTSGFGI